MSNGSNDMQEPRGFKKAYEKAKKVVEEQERVGKLVEAAEQKAHQQKGRMQNVWNDLLTLIRVIKAWFNGSYTGIPWRSMVYIVAALIYFVNPFDLVFDFIPGIGLIDDISVIGFVLAAVKKDLEQFREWEIESSTPV